MPIQIKPQRITSSPNQNLAAKMHSTLLVVGSLASIVLGQTQYTSTGTAAVAKARATALTESPTSNVPGKSFDRFVTIWCENTDYDMAAGDCK
jgi:hypothetical protein